MDAILIIGLLLLDQPGIGFMNQRRGLESMAWAFIPQMSVGYFAQFGLNQWNELI
jgi:hypothetical protein